ncbi:MAG: FliO/MopB family protein [Hyphomonadaceae bacterium]
MDWVEWARALFALIATLSLIGLAAWGVRRFGLMGGVRAGAERRLRVVETLMLDPRRRLVIVRHDDKEHLILLSASGDRRIDTSAAPREPAP